MNIITNAQGIPFLRSTTITVGAETVDIALGFRRVDPIGYLTIKLSSEIPADATGTLPVTLTLNGTTRALTLFNGNAVVASDLQGGTGSFLVFNNRFDGQLILMSRTTV